jgi:hypothetical protein
MSNNKLGALLKRIQDLNLAFDKADNTYFHIRKASREFSYINQRTEAINVILALTGKKMLPKN